MIEIPEGEGLQDPKPSPEAVSFFKPPQPAAPTAPDAALQEPSPEARSFFSKRKATAESDFLTMFGIASETDPTRFAEARDIARTLGVDPDTALENQEVLKSVWQKRLVENAKLAEKAPLLAKRFMDAEFARIAHDDLDNLGLFEGVIASWTAGRAEVKLARLQQDQMDFGDDPARMAEIRNLRRDLRHSPPSGGFVWGTARFGGQFTAMAERAVPVGMGAAAAAGAASAVTGPGAGPMMVGGFFSGFTASMLAQTNTIEAGLSYDQLLQMGYDPKAAESVSRGVGLVNAGLESVGTALQIGRPLIAPIKRALGVATAEALVSRTAGRARMEVVKSYLQGVAGEVATETLQEVVSMFAEDMAAKMTQNPDAKPSTFAEGKAWARLVETAVATAQVASVLGSVPEYIHYRDLMGKAGKAQATKQALTEAAAAVKDSKTLQRAPDLGTDFLAGVLRENKSENLYVDGRVLGDILRQTDNESAAAGNVEKAAAEQLNSAFPEIAAQLERATVEGGDVVIPTADFLKMADTPLGKKLIDNVRARQEDPSFAEVEQAKKDLPEMIQKLAKSAEEKDVFAESGDRFEEALLPQVEAAAPNLTAPQREAFVSLARRAYDRLATEQGKLPSELTPLRVTREPTPAAAPATVQEPGVTPPVETPPLEQPSRGYFDPKTNTITLTEKSDPTTLLHELSHAVWNMMIAVEQRTETLQRDLDSMFQFLGVTEQQWNELGPKQQEPLQERLAYSFEKYLAEGKAPTVELQGIFDRIAKWVRDVYRDVVGKINANYRREFGVDLPALTPEIRRFFGGMIAAEDEIVEAEAVRQRMATFETREGFPGTEQQWSEYQALVEARRAGGVANLTADVLKNISWLGRKREQITAEVTSDARKLRQDAGAEAKEEVEQRGISRLRTWLKTGKDEGEKPHRLNTGQIKEIFGPEAQDILTALEGSVSEKGWELELLAEDFEFDTAEAMVRALVDEPTMADAIEARTDEIMLRDNGTLRDAEEQAMAIEEALNNEAASKLAYATLRLVSEVKQPDRLTKAAVQEAARLRLENTPLRDIKARKYTMAAIRAEKAANDAFKGKRESKSKSGESRPARAPDAGEGIRFLQQYVLNTEMARQAAKIERETAKTTETLKKRFFAGDLRLRKKHNMDWVHVGQAIMAGFTMEGTRQTLPLEYMASIQEYDPLLYDRLVPYVTLATQGNTLQNYMDLPLNQFRDITDTLDSLWDRSIRERQVLAEGKLVEKDLAKQEIVDLLTARVGTPGIAVPLNALSRKDALWNSTKAQFAKVEHVFRQLDGNKPTGPMQKYLWTTLRQALDGYHKERSVYVGKLNALIQKLHDDGLLSTTKIEAPELGTAFDNTAHLLGAMQHIGNASNLQNMLIPYGWGTMVETVNGPVLDTRKWDDFLQRMFDSGRITKAHIDMLQKIGDLNAELKVQAQKVNKEAYGDYFKEIEVKPIKTPWGEYAGWYAPSMVDKGNTANSDIALGESAANPVTNAVNSMALATPSVQKGWTISRTGGVRPRLLDITQAASHFDTVLRFINLQIPLRDTWSLASDPGIMSLLDRAVPGFVPNVLKPMLDDTALGIMGKPGGGGEQYTKLVKMVTKNTGRMFMAASIVNWLQQYTGVASIATYVPKQFAWDALKRRVQMGAGPTREFIEAKSDSMKVRWQDHFGNQLTELQLFLDPSWKGKLDRIADRFAYYLTNNSQNAADQVAWLSGYNESLSRDPANEAAAVAAGDSLVRLTQGSKTTMDTAKVERGSATQKLLLQFTHYWINTLSSVVRSDDKARALFWSFLVPTYAGAAIALVLSGGKPWEDKDDDEEFDWGRTLWWTISTPVKGGTSSIPVVGPLASWLVTSEQRAGSNPPIAPAVAGLASTYNTLRNLGQNLLYIAGNDKIERMANRSRSGATSGQGIRDLGMTISYWTGIPLTPLTKALGFLEDRADGKTERNLASGILGIAR